MRERFGREQQLTHGPGGRIVTNMGAWSPDSEWILYDTRSDPEGSVFDGQTIERVSLSTGKGEVLYRSQNEACCGVATYHPKEDKVIFILGPENPTPDWTYGFSHRQGAIVEAKNPGQARILDARDLTEPFTPGALRGGSHVHVWEGSGEWVSFTYEDHILAQLDPSSRDHDLNQRNVGVSVPLGPVRVDKDHPRNLDGEYFTILATRTKANPRPGSDEISKAFEEGWVGAQGYVRPDGSRQRHALAFQGHVVTEKGETIPEVFIVDLPEDVAREGEGALAGTAKRMPCPPLGTVQRRLTRTADRAYPGIQGPRHWLRVSPDGSRIAFLMKDDQGVVQLWQVSPNGGDAAQITHNPSSIASAFTWSPDGRLIAYVMDQSVCMTEVASGVTSRLTPRSDESTAPKSETCAFSPDGRKIVYLRRLPSPEAPSNQIFVLHLP